MEGEILEVKQFIPPVISQVINLALVLPKYADAPKVWNELPYDIHSATSLLSFWKKLKAYVCTKAYQRCVS